MKFAAFAAVSVMDFYSGSYVYGTIQDVRERARTERIDTLKLRVEKSAYRACALLTEGPQVGWPAKKTIPTVQLDSAMVELAYAQSNLDTLRTLQTPGFGGVLLTTVSGYYQNIRDERPKPYADAGRTVDELMRFAQSTKSKSKSQ